MQRPQQEIFDCLDEETTLAELLLRQQHKNADSCQCFLHQRGFNAGPEQTLSPEEIEHLYPIGIIVHGTLPGRFSANRYNVSDHVYYKVVGYSQDKKHVPILQQIGSFHRTWITIPNCQMVHISQPAESEPEHNADSSAHSANFFQSKVFDFTVQMYGSRLMLNRADSPIRCLHKNKPFLRPWNGVPSMTHSWPS